MFWGFFGACKQSACIIWVKDGLLSFWVSSQIITDEKTLVWFVLYTAQNRTIVGTNYRKKTCAITMSQVLLNVDKILKD